MKTPVPLDVFGFLAEESWRSVHPLKTKCLCEDRTHQWWVQEFSGLWSQNPLIVRQRWHVQSKDLNSICFVSRDRDEGLLQDLTEVDGSGRARFHDNVVGGTFPCEQVRGVCFKCRARGIECSQKQNFRGDWNNGSRLLKGRAHFRLIR